MVIVSVCFIRVKLKTTVEVDNTEQFCLQWLKI